MLSWIDTLHGIIKLIKIPKSKKQDFTRNRYSYLEIISVNTVLSTIETRLRDIHTVRTVNRQGKTKEKS